MPEHLIIDSEPPHPASQQRDQPASAIYGAGFASVYATSRYTVFSEKMAKIALGLIQRHEAPGPSLLDLACGVGAGSNLFAKAGYDVTGIDASEEMIRRAAERAHEKGVSMYLYQQDMRDFQIPYPVDVVTCLGDALNYVLHEEDLARTFACVARALKPNGLFVFDMNTARGLATRWGTKDVVSTARADIVEINQNRYNPDTQINTTTTTVFVRVATAPDGSDSDLFRRYTELHRERGYSAETVTHLLKGAGMEPVSVEELADMTHGFRSELRPLTAEAGRLVAAARRNVTG